MDQWSLSRTPMEGSMFIASATDSVVQFRPTQLSSGSRASPAGNVMLRPSATRSWTGTARKKEPAGNHPPWFPPAVPGMVVAAFGLNWKSR